MEKTFLAWIIFYSIVISLLIFDLGFLNKDNKKINPKKSLLLTFGYFLIAICFGVFILKFFGKQSMIEYYTGFFIEKSMAIDNIFIILMVFSSMKIDEKYQHRILFFGIIGVILMRFIVISIGVNLIEKFSWILHILNLFLIILGTKMLIQKNENQKSILKNKFFVFIKKIIPHKDEINGPKFFISEFDQKTQKNKIYATPIFLSLLFIEIIDLIFAIDSLPAIFAITKSKYVIYTSNIFAILGLRALYFSLSGFYEKFTYLKYALGVLLIFIGGKSFIADFFGIQKIPAEISLVVTFLILSFGILFSLRKSKNNLNKINQKQT